MKKLYIAIIAFSVLFSSCDDFLEVSPESSIVNSSYWKTKGDVEAYKVGCYNTFRNANNGVYLGEERSDNFVSGSIGPTSSAWAQNIDKDHTSDMSGRYGQIYHYNLLYQKTQEFLDSDKEFAQNIMAEALMMRAYTYYDMIRTFGDVPLITKPYVYGETETIGRTPVKEVVNQIIKDIDEALTLFNSDGFTNKNLWTKPAAYALKSDVALWMKKVLDSDTFTYDQIISLIDKVEEAGADLEDSYASIFDVKNEKNKEIVFSLYFDKEEKHYMYIRNFQSRFANVASAYNLNNEISSGSGARHVYSASPKIIEAYKENINDTRYPINVYYVKAANETDTLLYTDWQLDKSQGDSMEILADKIVIASKIDTLLGGDPICQKFTGKYYKEENVVFYENDVIIYRWADLLLLRAEAKAANVDVDGAIEDLDKVRKRAGIGAYTGDKVQKTVELEILKERQRELFVEGKRWYDLFRAHEYGLIDVYTEVPNLVGKENSIFLYWPLSDDDLRENSLLKQTEGYEDINRD
jgi:hypothetical protein